MRFLKLLLISIFALTVSLLLILLTFGSSQPYSSEKLRGFALRLNEAAAIQIPHHFLMDEAIRQQHLTLLKKVETGAELTAENSARYRAIFQSNLAQSQSFLGRFDQELTILEDWQMSADNNVGQAGITGKHDHHDRSARLNFADVERSLSIIDKSTGGFGYVQRIRAINLAYKSLADVISHLGVAPHTVSVAYELPAVALRDPTLGSLFETVLRNYKNAQFETVNSTAYWRYVDRAVNDYARLVEQVQKRVHAKSTWWERRIAGRFLSLQTLAPMIEEDIPLRR